MTSEPDRLAAALAWLAENPRAARSEPTIPTLQRQFGLTMTEAVAAVKDNNLRLARAH